MTALEPRSRTLINRVALASLGLGLVLPSPPARALDEIIRPYLSVRDEAMGGVMYASGLYEDNFFGNPARTVANPRSKITLLDPTFQFSSNLPGTVSSLTGGGNQIYKNLGSDAGQYDHARFETTMPSYYFSHGKWSYAVGLIQSTQAGIDLRQSYNIDPLIVIDIGPAATVSRKFLKNDELAVGVTTHAMYRLSTNQDYGIMQMIQGQSLAPSATGGQGGMIDFDLGATYDFHWHPLGMNLQAAAAINDLLGGRFNNLHIDPVPNVTALPIAQPRTYNLGVSALRSALGTFRNTMVALDIQDIGYDANGSFYRLIHLGAETHLGVLALRAGLSQGYLCGGVGLDLRYFALELATYGEELGLNAGDLEDRIYAFRLALQI